MAEPNWANRTIWTGDNLPIMRGMNSESVDLIYLDPPFNSKANYAAPIGSEAAGAAFKDTWTLDDVDIAWLDLLEAKHPQLNKVINAAMTKSDKSYLIYMAVRLLEMHRILKSTGSIYLHCDPTMSHYLKLAMDAVFRPQNFLNEVVWYYRGAGVPKTAYARRHDILLWFAREKGSHYFDPDPIREDYADATKKRFSHYIGNVRGASDYGQQQLNPKGKHPDDVITTIQPIAPSAKARIGYPTQKPLALLQRLIQSSSNEGDVVLDPFCGCATTLVASDRLERNWAGIDISDLAATLVVKRIREDQGMFPDITAREDVPQRTDLGDLPKYNSLQIKNALYGEQGGNCNGCGTHFQKQNLTVDHIIAQSKGGTDHIENLQLLCGHCNSVKGDRGQEYLLAKLAN